MIEAPTLGDTTLISSLRKRNLPTSSWNLLPQLFMHVSSTWGEGVRYGGPWVGQRRQPLSHTSARAQKSRDQQ